MRFFLVARLVVFLCLLTLAACYRPLYGDKGFGSDPSAQEGRLNQVAISNIPDLTGQKLRNALIDRFYLNGRPARPDYQLDVKLTVVEALLGIQKDATAARARLDIKADYSLTDSKTRKLLFTGFSRSIVSYNKLDQEYGTLASKENATDRAARELADLIAARTTAVLEGLAEGKTYVADPAATTAIATPARPNGTLSNAPSATAPGTIFGNPATGATPETTP